MKFCRYVHEVSVPFSVLEKRKIGVADDIIRRVAGEATFLTSTWLLREARCSAVYPSSFFSSTIHGRGSFDRSTRIALQPGEERNRSSQDILIQVHTG